MENNRKFKINKWILLVILLFVFISIVLLAIPQIYKQPKVSNKSNLSSTTVTKDSTISENGNLISKLAFIRDDNLWIQNNGVETQLTTDAIPAEIPYFTGTPRLWYSNPQISHDGTRIAYLKNISSDSRILLVSDIDGKNVKELANDIEWTMPIVQWTKDDRQIYYPSSGNMESVKVKSVNVLTGDKSEYGQFSMFSGCGGGGPDPADHISAGENIISVGGGVQIFNLSPGNNFIVHTINCTGTGLGIFDLTTEQDKILSDTVTKAAISSDGKSIATISSNNIIIFDVDNNTQKTYQTIDKPNILLRGGANKTIYYSSSNLSQNLDFDDKIAMDILGDSSIFFRANTSTLWKLSLDSGISEKIMDFDAHYIKPIFESNQKLLVIEVENSTVLYDYINREKTTENIVKYYPKVKLAEIDISDLSSTTIENNVRESSLRSR